MIFARKTLTKNYLSVNFFSRPISSAKVFEKFDSQERCLAGLETILGRYNFNNIQSDNYQELSSIMYQIQEKQWWPEKHNQINATLQYYYQNNRFPQIITFYNHLKNNMKLTPLSDEERENNDNKHQLFKTLSSKSISIILGGFGWASDLNGAIEFIKNLQEVNEKRRNLYNWYHPFIIQSVRNNKNENAYHFFIEMSRICSVDQEEYFWMLSKIDKIEMVLEIWKMVEKKYKETLSILKGFEILLSAIIKEKVNVRDAGIFLVRIRKEIQTQNKQKLIERKDSLLSQTQSKLEEKTVTLAVDMPTTFPLKKLQKSTRELLNLSPGNENLIFEIREFVSTLQAKNEEGWKEWNDNM